mgnify:CR=1 FL=1
MKSYRQLVIINEIIQLENAALEIQKILSGEEEPSEQQKNKNLQLMAVSSALKEDFCESCGEKGHKIWACPNK